MKPASIDTSGTVDYPFNEQPALEHRAQNLKQIFAARMLYFEVLDRPDVLHK